MTAPMVSVPRDIHPMDAPYDCEAVIKLLANPPSAKPFNDEMDYYQDWWRQLLTAAAPAPQPVQGEAAEHRMMLDDLRLYGAAFSKNGKRIPPEDVYITQPPAPAVGDDHSTAMEGWHGAINDACEIAGNTSDQRIVSRASRIVTWIRANKPQPTPAVQIAAPGDVEQALEDLRQSSIPSRSYDFIAAALRSQGQADAVVAMREVLGQLCAQYIANPGTEHDYVRCVTPNGPRLADSETGKLWLRAAALAQQANKETSNG